MTITASSTLDEVQAALASALLDSDDAAFEAAAERAAQAAGAAARARFRDVCAAFGATDAPASAVEPDDYDADGNGGLLWLRIPARPARLIDGCPDMARLADDGYGGAL